jgi:flavin-dependent dehydrogenase
VAASSAEGDVFDVAVIGAGPAGSAAARWLALDGARVALVERSTFEDARVGESLAPAVRPWLVRLGVWDDFLALRPLPSYGTRSVWGQESPQTHSHLASPWGHGWHVDRSSFDRQLADAACRAGASPFFGTSLAGCAHDDRGWHLSLAGHSRFRADRSIRARLLIDATGRAARCAAWTGARRRPVDRLVAATLRFERPGIASDGHVLVEATPDGWWYSAPIPGEGMVAMLLTDGDLARALQLQEPSAWHARLASTTATRERLAGTHAQDAPRLVFAGSHRLVRGQSRAPWLSVGDAAIAVDPISGSGIVRALTTAWHGVETARSVLESGRTDALAAYEAARDAEFVRYLAERSAYYGFELRFARHPFWQRRAPETGAPSEGFATRCSAPARAAARSRPSSPPRCW